MAVRDRGRISSGEGAARHPAHASAVLFGNRLLVRISSHDAILASTACRDRWIVGSLFSAGHSNIALFDPQPPPSLLASLSCRNTTAFQAPSLSRSPRPARDGAIGGNTGP